MADLLSYTPVKPADIPSEDALLAAGRALLELTSSWQEGKTYFKLVQSRYCPGQDGPGGHPWHCRVSEHVAKEATFDEMWEKLGKSKAVHEQQYIPQIKKVSLVKALSLSQEIWTLYYTFTPPISPRVFTVLQTIHLDEASPRTGMIVTIPIDLSSPDDEDLAKIEERGVKGRYVSVERIMELGDGRVEWRMATSSTPGGSIPTFLAEASIAKSIAEDVPHFFKWYNKLKAENTSKPHEGDNDQAAIREL